MPVIGVNPPCAPLAFRVGIVGHRPDRLREADTTRLSHAILEILSAIRDEVVAFGTRDRTLYADGTPVLRAISSLAEGSDRLFADRALDLRFELCCPFPFPQTEFERDFQPPQALVPDSLDSFRALLDRAARESALTVFELDGSRTNEAAAYAAGGRVVLNQSDMLVVVWDGQRLSKRGGTEDTFAQALAAGLPIVHVDACAPHGWRLVDPSLMSLDQVQPRPSGGTAADLHRIVRTALALPPDMHASSERPHGHDSGYTAGIVALRDFYTERRPRLNVGAMWRIFRDRLGSDVRLADEPSWTFPDLEMADFETAVMGAWPDDDSTPTRRLVHRLRPFYAWPDQLAIFYADTYRSAFVASYLLAALAVSIALLPVGFPRLVEGHRDIFPIVGELLTIGLVVGLVAGGRYRRWHERWLDYRLMAELLRHVRMVAPLGGSRPLPPLPPHLSTYGHPGATWIAWYIRAVERHIGLPTGRVDEAYLDEALGHSTTLLEEQVTYHEINARRCHRLHERLHRYGLRVLALTLLAVLVHLIHPLASTEAGHRIEASVVDALPWVRTVMDGLEWMSGLLVAASAFLPALGAALVGINNQGEFLRIAKRSDGMQTQLRSLLARSAALRQSLTSSDPRIRPTSLQVAEQIAQGTQLMVNETLDWRVVFVDRPLNPPS